MTQPFAVDGRFVPSTGLGGDAFGYGFIDAEHFALYLLDVCGHGIGPSLLSVAVLHLLRVASRGDLDLREPGAVLAGGRYQMKSNNDLYFTLWYGVYRPADRRLTYGCAGHTPAFLIEGDNVRLLKAAGRPIGLRAGAASGQRADAQGAYGWNGAAPISTLKTRYFLASFGKYDESLCNL
jgi:sigma-B regulation protein RsbU (phosphoserine phosphatase)